MGLRWATLVSVLGRPRRRPVFRYYDQFATVLAIAFAAAVLLAAVMWALAQAD